MADSMVSGGGRRRSPRLPDVSADELRRLYSDEGFSTAAIAHQAGCSGTAIRNLLIRHGIARRTSWEHNAVVATVDELRRLYIDEGLSLSATAERLGCSLTTVWRKLKAAGIETRPDGGVLQYARCDFSGDRIEMAYLIGFRIGDLHVALEGDTIVVKCTSTREEQVKLFRSLFEPYGRVYTDEATIERRARKSVGMYARLNRSFDFLLPKEDRVPPWILSDTQSFFAFFAGYLDAEGYFQISLPKGYRTPQVRLDVRSYDKVLLRQVSSRLQLLGIACPDARMRVAAGYVNKSGVRSNQPLWGISINRVDSLLRVLPRIDTYLRHPRRRRDMQRAASILAAKQTAADRRATIRGPADTTANC